VRDCCSPEGYRQIFSERRARAETRRYRRRGLDRTSRRVVELLKDQGVAGRTLLEVGGGIGAIEIELLRAGVSRAVCVELTPTYEKAASTLLQESGLAGRVERRVMDFAESGAEVAAADIVVLNRVICCYPDMPRLAAAAADHTERTLLISFPNGRLWTRAAVATANFGLRIIRRRFRIFAHPPPRILATMEQHGLRTRLNRRGVFWQVASLERAAQTRMESRPIGSSSLSSS
jgi:hypothetical protein